MPITLKALSRRQFLAGSVAAGLSLALRKGEVFGAEENLDPHRLSLLSDVHIAADGTHRERGVVMYENLKHATDEILGLASKPAGVFINGDCAFLQGKVEDYQTLLTLLTPLRERGLTLHLSMGNHDNREHLWKTVPDSESHVGEMTERQVAMLEFPRANVFLLDSLDVTNHTPGVMGDLQAKWLAAALDAHATKPAIVMIHHQPDERPKPSGLTDTKALLDVLIPRTQVKALFYGHTHVWEMAERSGIHCVNLPAVAYVFSPGQPSGWVDAHLQESGMTLELRCIDPTHPKHGEKVDLKWRA